MKKLITLFFLFMIASNVTFASELGENAASDCKYTQQSSRFQQTVSDGTSAAADQTGQSTGR